MRAFSHLKRGGKIIVGVFGLSVCLIISIGTAFTIAYWQRILPGVSVNGINASNMTAKQLSSEVDKQIKEKTFKLTAKYQDSEYTATDGDLGISWSITDTVNNAWYVGRQGNIFERFGSAWKSFFVGQKIDIAIKEDGATLNNWVANVAKDIDSQLVRPSFNLESKKLVFVTGKDGLSTDQESLKQTIRGRAQKLSIERVEIPVSRQTVQVSDEKLKTARESAESLIGKSLKFSLDGESWNWGDDQLVRMVSVVNGDEFDELAVIEEVDVMTKGVNHEPQNAALQFENGKVTVFRPGKDGIEIETLNLVQKIEDSIGQLRAEEKAEIEIPVKRTAPAISTGDVNNLGIKELLGQGKSTYQHSIPNRIHNVALAASRINGVLVPPGAEFSFNESLGDVSRATGYLSAYVIENGRTVLGDGGGVCQVSTTVFRAAMAAGLPITDRKAHAYRVGYYEQDSLPGIDATVYSPSADLKFKNDTPNNLLIQTKTDSSTQKMTVEIYGTSDGRKSSVSTPKVWNQSPPPPTLYQDDPTLSVGTLKQVDFAAAGAKVSFDYVVTRDGNEIFSKTFYSNYQSWQAVFLKGTKI